LLRKLRTPSPVSVHSDQNSTELPIEVRNKLFFHYHHFCAVLDCPHAPVEEIKKLVKYKNKYINFFPRLSKGMKKELVKKLKSIQSEYFPEMELSTHKAKVSRLIEHEDFKNFKGVDQGIAYLFAETLNGKRHIGSMDQIIQKHTSETLVLKTIGNTFDSPLLVINPLNERAFICSSVNNSLNQQLIKTRIKVDNLTINLK